jgi:ribosomal-protein-alanine N-acetyltransferase
MWHGVSRRMNDAPSIASGIPARLRGVSRAPAFDARTRQPRRYNRRMHTLPMLHTERTIMTLPAPEQAPLLLAYRLRNRAHLAPWEPARGPSYFTEDAARRRLQQSLDEARAGSALHFIALGRDDGAVVATCAFTNIVHGVFQACHVGFSVAASCQGRGLMHEVVRAGIDHVFGAERLHRIMASHMPANLRSAALLARLGFEREGYARSYLRIDGAWEDMVLTSLINPCA